MFKIFIFYFILSFFFFLFLFYFIFFLHFMYEKEVAFAWNPSNRKFLREKRNQAWNSKQRIKILVEMNEIITTTNLFSFASLSCWLISERKKKSNQRIVLQRGKETWIKERREKDLWEGERPELVTVRVWGEKK